MDEKIRAVSGIRGTLTVAGDKSVSHRALILGAMSQGTVRILNLSPGKDCASTISCLRGLGVQIEEVGPGELMVEGRGINGFDEPSAVLDAENSGTTMRLMCGLLAGQTFYSVITGDDSLRTRPMGRIIDPLRLMGARLFARDGDTRAPITVVGSRLKPIDYTLPVASAQVKSAVLIAGLLCDGKTTVRESIESRDHTERMLKHMGADISASDGAVVLRGTGTLDSGSIFVPGDISSAAYLILAAILVPGSFLRIVDVGLNPTRLGFVDALIGMGADIKTGDMRLVNEEHVGTIEVRSSLLRAIEVTPDTIPAMVDEIPALALAATQAAGKTSIRGAGELRFKESDRLKTTATELKRLGARITELKDGLEIEGPTELKGGTCLTYGDHRLALILGVAGLIARGETVIRDAQVVDVSFPGFFEQLAKIGCDGNA